MKNFTALQKTIFSVLAAVVIGVFLAVASLPVPISAVRHGRLHPDETFRLEAHRGGRDERPENTIMAYEHAMKMGATVVECDMQMTGDGHIVMSHNPTLDADMARDASGAYVARDAHDLRRMTLDEIRVYDVGTPRADSDYEKAHVTEGYVSGSTKIPTLDEMFALADAGGYDSVKFDVETKSFPDPSSGYLYKYNPDPERFVNEFYRVVKEHHMERRVTLQSFDWRTIAAMKSIDASVECAALWSPGIERATDGEGRSYQLAGIRFIDFMKDPIIAAHEIGADIFSSNAAYLTHGRVREAHLLGMPVLAWTVNDEKTMERLIDMGVDGIITDRPLLLKSVLDRRGIEY